jgi:hypothetical protein
MRKVPVRARGTCRDAQSVKIGRMLASLLDWKLEGDTIVMQSKSLKEVL